MALAEAGLVKVWLPACAAMLLGALIPLWTYPVLRFGGKISAVDSAAIAAHYGSVSAVTFITPPGLMPLMLIGTLRMWFHAPITSCNTPATAPP